MTGPATSSCRHVIVCAQQNRFLGKKCGLRSALSLPGHVRHRPTVKGAFQVRIREELAQRSGAWSPAAARKCACKPSGRSPIEVTVGDLPDHQWFRSVYTLLAPIRTVLRKTVRNHKSNVVKVHARGTERGVARRFHGHGLNFTTIRTVRGPSASW